MVKRPLTNAELTALEKPKRGRPPKAPKATPGHNEAGGDERRALFLSDVAKRKKLIEAKDAAVAALRNNAKSIKADGFTILQVDTAIRLQTPDGEAAIREKMADQIQAAQWIGSPVGTQFSFDLTDRTPAVDRAFDEGKQAEMEGKRATPPYDPSVPQYHEWLKGYHASQESKIRAGIKPVEAAGWGERDPGRPLDA